jgi:hypothetical protein
MSRFQPDMAAMYALTGAYIGIRGSRPRRGRPTVPLAIGQFIREMSLANPLWGAHGSTASCSYSASLSADERREVAGGSTLKQRERTRLPAVRSLLALCDERRTTNRTLKCQRSRIFCHHIRQVLRPDTLKGIRDG